MGTQIALKVVTGAVGNDAVVEPKDKLELVRLSKNYLRQLSRYAYDMRTLLCTGFLYMSIHKY